MSLSLPFESLLYSLVLWNQLRLQTNHLSSALLSLLLLPKMLATARNHPKATKPCISIVSSETHYFGKFTEPALQSGNLLETLGSEEYCRTQSM